MESQQENERDWSTGEMCLPCSWCGASHRSQLSVSRFISPSHTLPENASPCRKLKRSPQSALSLHPWPGPSKQQATVGKCRLQHSHPTHLQMAARSVNRSCVHQALIARPSTQNRLRVLSCHKEATQYRKRFGTEATFLMPTP